MSVLADYATEFLKDLRECAETTDDVQKFVAERLRRTFKHKMLGKDMTVDLGRGRGGLAFLSDGSIEQTAALLAAARYFGTKPPIPLKFVFDGGDTDNCDTVLDGVFEAYGFMPCELDVGKIGYCYGTACAGRAEMSLDFESVGNSLTAANAAESVERSVATAVNELDVELDVERITDSRFDFVMRYFDSIMSESAAMAIEHAALAADDKYGTAHGLSVKSVRPPVTNYALAVDKVRYIAGERAKNVPPFRDCYPLSEMLRSHGCLIFVGAGRGLSGDIAAATAELIGEILYTHVG